MARCPRGLRKAFNFRPNSIRPAVVLCSLETRVKRFLVLLVCGLLLPSIAFAQLEPPSTGGLAALDQDLRMLGAHKRVLMIAAHPDDEDTELLTVLVRGLGTEAGYLSLNRGEGGQNLIGDELGEGLGLLRTEELLAARRLDGARQFFTRAYDFGFSKSLEDTWAHWPRDSVLKDVVRTIRRFRPQVIVSVFSGTPRDGHGQHQAAGWAAQEAYRIAGDSTRFPELLTEEGLRPWAPAKLYRSTRFDTAATTLKLDGGTLDAAVGQSYHQIAMRGRSLHRSQDMGQLQGIGPSLVRLQLIDDRTQRGQGGLFDGIDTSLVSLAPSAAQPLRRYAWLADSARAARRNGTAQVPLLVAMRAALLEAIGARPEPGRAASPLREQLERLDPMIQRAEGLVFDAVADDERVSPGQVTSVTVTAWNAGRDTFDVVGRTGTRLGQLQGPADSVVTLVPGAVARWVYTGRVTADPTTGAPYFLRQPRNGDLYSWPGAADSSVVPGTPFEVPEQAVLRFRRSGSGDGGWMTARRELAWRTNDQARGEVRRPVLVVPRVDLRLDPANEVWRAGSVAPQHFTVTLTHGARDTTMGTVSLELPAGWRPVPAQKFTLTREDERQEFQFSVTPGALQGGSFTIHAVATDLRRQRYDLGVLQVDYPHIHPRSYTRTATATVHVAPVDFPALARIGYVRGAADRVPEALESVRLPIEILTGQDLATRSLARYGAIVIGPRAWETDSALPGANDRLLAYAREGGTVLVQYQQYGYFLGDFAPYPLTVGSRQPGGTTATVTSRVSTQGPAGTALLGGHDRVTDETAPVTILDPRNPLVLTPNRLGPEDWKGWVQERGLYFAHSWDPAWKTVFEMHDPGETPLEGGLLISKVGKGTYVYTGLAFFRQLPAGVPGAYRLFANLLALGRGTTR
jgi:LmbE family N-acetylglucosaminyl deacetylase